MSVAFMWPSILRLLDSSLVTKMNPNLLCVCKRCRQPHTHTINMTCKILPRISFQLGISRIRAFVFLRCIYYFFFFIRVHWENSITCRNLFRCELKIKGQVSSCVKNAITTKRLALYILPKSYCLCNYHIFSIANFLKWKYETGLLDSLALRTVSQPRSQEPTKQN